MAGLLGDGWDSAQSQGLLALASGMIQGNFGKGVSDMNQTMSGAQDREMKRKLMQAQIEDNASQIEARKDASTKAKFMQGLLGSFGFGAASTDAGGDSVPDSTYQPAPAKTGGGIGNLSIDQIAALKAAGGPDLLDAYKWVKDPLKLEQGATYQDRGTGATRFMPKVDSGIAPDGNGNYRPLPGYANAQGTIDGEKAAAVERAKANYDFVELPDGNGGTRKMPRSQAVNLMNGAPAPAGYASEPAMRTTAQGNIGADPRAIQREIAQATTDLQNVTDPASKQHLTNYIKDLTRQAGNLPAAGQPAPNNWGASLTPAQQIAQDAEKVKAVEQAKADVIPAAAKQASIDSARNAYNLVSTALSHPGIDSATGLSGAINPSNYIPGTDAKNFNVLAKQLKGNVFLSAFSQLKGSGAITEIEGLKAEQAIARMDQSQSTDEYKQALKDYQSIMAQGLKRMGVELPKNEDSGKPTVVSTGLYKGKKVNKYSDGSISYAN